MSNEWMKQFEAMKDDERPFASLVYPDISDEFKLKEANKKLGYLTALKLNPLSTAAEVRQTAESIRSKFEDDEGGINRTTFRALEWALKETRDVIGIMEFVYFLNTEGVSLSQIAANRFGR